MAKLKTKSSQKTEMCELKLKTGSMGNLMPNRMYKLLFQENYIDKLNKSINMKTVLYVYSTSCIPQIGMCHIAINNKGIKYQCNFFVVPGNRPTLVGCQTANG